jgi:hypothetical protein
MAGARSFDPGVHERHAAGWWCPGYSIDSAISIVASRPSELSIRCVASPSY